MVGGVKSNGYLEENWEERKQERGQARKKSGRGEVLVGPASGLDSLRQGRAGIFLACLALPWLRHPLQMTQRRARIVQGETQWG